MWCSRALKILKQVIQYVFRVGVSYLGDRFFDKKMGLQRALFFFVRNNVGPYKYLIRMHTVHHSLLRLSRLSHALTADPYNAFGLSQREPDLSGGAHVLIGGIAGV
jgi:hypothetical protein